MPAIPPELLDVKEEKLVEKSAEKDDQDLLYIDELQKWLFSDKLKYMAYWQIHKNKYLDIKENNQAWMDRLFSETRQMQLTVGITPVRISKVKLKSKCVGKMMASRPGVSQHHANHILFEFDQR